MTHETVSRYPLDKLIEIMALLRSDAGCPWDRKQDHHTLARYAVEEVYELLAAIESCDDDALMEELGDVLLQVVFHCQIAAEEGRFDIRSVIERLCEKLIRRHPHVFASHEAMDAESVEHLWTEIKREERKQRADASRSLLEDVPGALPALAYAQALQERTALVGFEWDDVQGALQKLIEEAQEIVRATQEAEVDSRHLEEEWGDLLFSLVNVSRYIQIDSESALRVSARKFADRFRFIEARARERGKSLEELSLAEMDALWESAKQHLAKSKSGRDLP